MGQLRSTVNVFVCCLQISIADIFFDGSGKQMGILQNNAQGVAQILQPDLIDVDTVVTDFPLFNVVKAVDEIRDGCFSGTGTSYKSNLLSRCGKHFHIV